MIVRTWRGWVATDRAAEYVDYILATGMAEYRATPGNLDAQLLTRDLGDGRTEVVTLSWWDSLESIRAFAGDDLTAARYYAEDEAFLLAHEDTVTHHEVHTV